MSTINMAKYTINELANSKGITPLAREALLQMEAELDAIRQALAAPVQEPVGVFVEDDDIGHVRLNPHQQLKLKDGDPVYATPPTPTGNAPCARHCEATAFQIMIRGLRGDIERMKSAQPAQSLTRSELRGLWLSRQAHMDGWDFYVAIDARLFGSAPAQPAPKERT